MRRMIVSVAIATASCVGCGSSESALTGSTGGLLAYWDMCGGDSMQIMNPESGSKIRSVALAGRPSWSPDARTLASLDNADGMIRTADVATGDTRVIVDLKIPPYAFDSCGTSGQVQWSPDGAALLVIYTSYSKGPDSGSFIRVVRLDGSGDKIVRKLGDRSGLPGFATARWLAGGDVILAYWEDTSELTVERGDPWQPWPRTSNQLPRPDVANLYSPSISPDGARLAFATMDETPQAGCSATEKCTGGVVVVDTADGSSRAISNRVSQGPLAFSPDGRHVAFVEYDFAVGYPATLVVAAADGSGAQVIEGVAGDNVSWSPDSQSVVVAGFTLDRVDLSDGKIKALVKRQSGPMLPSFAVDWSPMVP